MISEIPAQWVATAFGKQTGIEAHKPDESAIHLHESRKRRSANCAPLAAAALRLLAGNEL